MLYKIGYSQNNYDQSKAYLLGKLFSHIDKIHKEYIGKGKVSQLIGSRYIDLLINDPLSAVNLVFKDSIYILSRVKTLREKTFLKKEKQSCFYDFFGISNISSQMNDIPAKWKNEEKMMVALGYFLNK